jgi:hypothetical protein
MSQMNYVRTRIHSESNRLELYPVCRVSISGNGNVYFIPVSRFPISDTERKSIRYFLDELWRCYSNLAESNLRRYLGILNKVIEFDILEKMCLHMFDWPTQVAIALSPDHPPSPLPTREEVLSWKEMPSAHEFIPMITYMAREGALAEAHEELFGCGGTILYTSTHGEEKLFAKTKEIFGYKISSPYLQFMQCLPVLEINDLLEATDNQFKALHSAIGLYIGESMRDRGVVIISDKNLDRKIADLVYLLPDGCKRGRSRIHDSLEM